MKNFSEFGITVSQPAFTGDKIKIDKVLNRQIAVYDYKIEDSKFKGKCLYLQITYKDEKHVVFTGATGLMDVIQRINKEDFPFLTTIEKVSDRYEFR